LRSVAISFFFAFRFLFAPIREPRRKRTRLCADEEASRKIIRDAENAQSVVDRFDSPFGGASRQGRRDADSAEAPPFHQATSPQNVVRVTSRDEKRECVTIKKSYGVCFHGVGARFNIEM
jgi:hypothetical protein